MIVVESFVKCAQGNHYNPVCSNRTRQGCFGRHPLETPEHTQTETAGLYSLFLHPRTSVPRVERLLGALSAKVDGSHWICGAWQ